MTTIIYHRSDPDGWMSNTVCLKFLPCDTVSFGWDYGDPVPDLPATGDIYMVDISVDKILDDPAMWPRLVWIDHHRTALERWEKLGLHGVRIDGVAACRLCWWWFKMMAIDPAKTMRTPFLLVSERIDWSKRQPGEPEALFLVGLRDVWKHEGTRDEWACNVLNLALVSRRDNESLRQDLLCKYDKDTGEPDLTIVALCKEGEAIQRYADSLAAEHVERGAMMRPWRGLVFLMLNSQARGSKTLDGFANELTKRENGNPPFDALMVWAVGKDGMVNASLYHAPHRKDIDLSVLAKSMGGGGHAGAAGFRATLPWMEGLIAEEEEVLEAVSA